MSNKVGTKPQESSSNTFNIRPPQEQKFHPPSVKECIRLVVSEELGDKTYNAEDVPLWSKSVADAIQNKVKELGYSRYKTVVQVVIGEQRGEGVKMGTRCLWDADTDSFASEIFTTKTLFCVAAVFGTYYY